MSGCVTTRPLTAIASGYVAPKSRLTGATGPRLSPAGAVRFLRHLCVTGRHRAVSLEVLAFRVCLSPLGR